MQVFEIEPSKVYNSFIIRCHNPNDNKTEEILRFGDSESFNDLVEWLFENTKGRFVFLGMNKIYFEKDEDATAFKLFCDNAVHIK